MSVPSSFLTLSIREQLCITILILTLFSLLVILCLPGSFSYEILMEDYKKKKKFFYNEYKEYIQTCFDFHSFNILKYEEIIKRMAKQIYKYNTRETIYEYDSDFSGNNNVQNFTENEENDDNILYYYCYNENETVCSNAKKILANRYESLNGLIFSHDVINRIKMPGYDMPIIDSFVGVSVNDSVIYGFNKTGLSSAIINETNSTNFNKTELKKYYQNIVEEQMGYAYNSIMSSLNLDLFLYQELFKKTVSEMNEMYEYEYSNQTNQSALSNFTKAALGYYSIIELSNNKCYLVTHVSEQDKYYYFQFNLIENFLDIIGRYMSDNENMDFIPLYSFNHTIMSPGLCTNFLMKQSKQMYNEKTLNETYSKIRKGVDGIEACIYDKTVLENSKIKEMLETNITHFLVSNNKFYQGLIELDQPYFFLKASFPNLNALKEYQSDYFLLDQIDFYLFAPFKEPIEFAKYIRNQYINLFYLIVILLLYIWIICFIVNMIIYCKVAKQITEPIYRLQEAIENNNLKDESVFKYEYDEIINELCITCKELLTGQIDASNSLKYAGQFNILNKQNDKDKVIDKNKYEKNLIINNDIVNDLINEQQNMMNFKKEIDVNDEYTFNQDSEGEERAQNNRKRTIKSKVSNYDDNKENIENNENIENRESIKQSKNQEEEDRDKRSYKSMFRLAQYLYYYRCKVEENNIVINTNSNNDDKKSNISKINNNNQNQNLPRNPKHIKSISRSGTHDINEDNLTINVLRGKDMTYLWYMEMKKKNNKSFNYQLSDDLEELFSD